MIIFRIKHFVCDQKYNLANVYGTVLIVNPFDFR